MITTVFWGGMWNHWEMSHQGRSGNFHLPSGNCYKPCSAQTTTLTSSSSWSSSKLSSSSSSTSSSPSAMEKPHYHHSALGLEPSIVVECRRASLLPHPITSVEYIFICMWWWKIYMCICFIYMSSENHFCIIFVHFVNCIYVYCACPLRIASAEYTLCVSWFGLMALTNVIDLAT